MGQENILYQPATLPRLWTARPQGSPHRTKMDRVLPRLQTSPRREIPAQLPSLAGGARPIPILQLSTFHFLSFAEMVIHIKGKSRFDNN